MKVIRKKLEVADFDQFSEVVAGFETRPVQLSSGPLDLRLDVATLEHCTLFRMALAPKVADIAVIEQGKVGFVLVEHPQVWCGIELRPPLLFIWRSGFETSSVLEPGFRSTEFMISEDSLADHPLGRRIQGVGLEPENSIFPLSDLAARALQATAQTILSSNGLTDLHLDLEEDSGQDWIRSQILDTLDRVLAQHLPQTTDKPPPARRARYQLALAALLQIDQVGACDISPAAIAAGLGVTRRALEQAFKSVIGVSPAQYLIAHRLTRVRSRLVSDGSPVIDTAFNLGFEHPSRFAHQYRRLFGELPSITLARRHQLTASSRA